MKSYFNKSLLVLVAFVLFLSACSGSRESTHHRGVNNKAYKGY